MSQDCPTSFHFAAHILHWGLLPVWVKHMTFHCHKTEAKDWMDLTNIPHIQICCSLCQSSIPTPYPLFVGENPHRTWRYSCIHSIKFRSQYTTHYNTHQLHLLLGSRGVLSSFFRLPLLTQMENMNSAMAKQQVQQ